MNEYHKPNRRKRRFTDEKQYTCYKGMNQDLYCVEALERLVDVVNDAIAAADKIKKLFKN